MTSASSESTRAAWQVEFASPIAATSSNLSINNLQEMFSARSLKLRPAFQRNLVWNPEQQSFLIDTVLRGLPVPEVYIQRKTSEDGANEQTVVVDGQQRITALLLFLNGHLTLLGTEDDLDSRWRGKKFNDLDNTLKARFRTFQLVARELPNLEEPVLREVFRRLNKTVEPLEPQELRHAAYGGRLLKLIEKAASSPVFSDVGIFSPKDYLRRRNDEFMAEVLFAYTSGAFPNKKDGLEDFFLTRERRGMEEAEGQDLERRLGRVFAELAESAQTIRKTRFKNKSDFYSLFVFLMRNADALPLDPEHRSTFADVVVKFAARVTDIKRNEDDEEKIGGLVSDDFGVQAQKYLRAVERAASDRLSRVRRDEALQAVFADAFASAPVKSLEPADAHWVDAEESEIDPADEILGPEDIETERKGVQDALMKSKSDFDDLLGIALESDAEK